MFRVHVLLNERVRYLNCFRWAPEPDASFRGGPIPFLCFNRKKLACRTGVPRACSKHLNANPLKREAMRGVEVMFKCAFTWMLCYEVHQLLKSLVPGCIGKIKKHFSSSLLTIWVGNLRRYHLINALSKSSYKKTPTDATAIHPLTRLCVSTYQLTMVAQIFMKPSKTAFLRSVNLTNLLFTQSIPQNTTTLRSSDHKLNLHVLAQL